jgi:anti-sigma B factor antagonist
MPSDATARGTLVVDVFEEGPTATVAVTGELDIATTAALEEALAAVAPRERLVLDHRGLSFMDSTGVRVVMNLDLRSRAEGWTHAILRRSGAVARVLDLCRVPDRVLTVGDLADLEQ